MKYRVVLSSRKINCLILAAAGISLFSALSYTLGAIYDVYALASFGVFLLDCVIMLFISVIYILTKVIIRKRSKSANRNTADRMKEVDKTITVLCKMVLFSLLFFYGFYTLTSTSNIYFYGYARTKRVKSWFEFFLFFGMMIALTNSAMNAVAFLVINKKTHVFLRKLFFGKIEDSKR